MAAHWRPGVKMGEEDVKTCTSSGEEDSKLLAMAVRESVTKLSATSLATLYRTREKKGGYYYSSSLSSKW